MAVTGDEFVSSPVETEMIVIVVESQLIIQESPIWRLILDRLNGSGGRFISILISYVIVLVCEIECYTLRGTFGMHKAGGLV